MSGKAAKIRLTEGQTAILQQIIRSMTAPQRLVQRARLIVLAFGGMFNGSISGIIGLQRKQVGLWRQRWKQSFDALVAIECRESRAALRRTIEEVLGDAPRSGSFGKFTAEQVTQVLAVACEPADQSGRPINEWTGRELADELVQRGIVASISASQVNRYLAAAELQPHRSKLLAQHHGERPAIIRAPSPGRLPVLSGGPATVLPAPHAHDQRGRNDGRSGVGAEREDRADEAWPTGGIEFEYTRHGTVCLTGNWHVVLGQMIALRSVRRGPRGISVGISSRRWPRMGRQAGCLWSTI